MDVNSKIKNSFECINFEDVQLNKDDNQKLSFVTEFIEIIEKLTNE